MPGAALKRSASTKLKTAALAPVPSVSVSTAIDVHPGVRTRVRAAYRKSCRSVSMGALQARVVPRAAAIRGPPVAPLPAWPGDPRAARVSGIEQAAHENRHDVIVIFWRFPGTNDEHTSRIQAACGIRF